MDIPHRTIPKEMDKAEATNKVILAGLKKRLDDAKGRQVEELPHVLRAYRTTPRRSTKRDSLFNDVWDGSYNTIGVGVFPPRSPTRYDEACNHDLMNDCLNTIEESREIANVKMGNYQQKLKQTYDKGVKTRPLVPGDLVLRKVVGVAKNPAWGKLGPKREGPYRITSDGV
ncbi:uncharacterized protein LOC142628302 [Castanea sativa]|uniref:uncharacterized protein LOC142628302 n=1 Tax=Castanea sativa TaxID=21020 RepID=UPI003F64FE72